MTGPSAPARQSNGRPPICIHMTDRDPVLNRLDAIWVYAIGEIAREIGGTELDAILYVAGNDIKLPVAVHAQLARIVHAHVAAIQLTAGYEKTAKSIAKSLQE
jgi:hypothetical protein